MRLLIDARLPNSGSGGVQQVVKTLASAVSEFEQESIEVNWLLYKGTNWWEPFISKNQNKIFVNPPGGAVGIILGERFPRLISLIRPLYSRIISNRRKYPFNQLLEENKIDLIHFPFQDGFKTKIPYIYHPHDLQHLYLPQNFSKYQIKHRETHWRELAVGARSVVVESDFVVKDLLNFWGLKSERISVIQTPSIRSTPTLSWKLQETENYIFYPAAFWPHKNHENLIRALNILRLDYGLDLNLHLSGSKVGNFKKILRLVRDLKLEKNVTFLGHIDDLQVDREFIHARLVVIPTLFESISLPLWEGMSKGVPVVASRLYGLAEQLPSESAGFDPLDPEHISSVIAYFLGDEAHLVRLSLDGFNKISCYTLKEFQAKILNLYREVLSNEKSKVK